MVLVEFLPYIDKMLLFFAFWSIGNNGSDRKHNTACVSAVGGLGGGLLWLPLILMNRLN